MTGKDISIILTINESSVLISIKKRQSVKVPFKVDVTTATVQVVQHDTKSI